MVIYDYGMVKLKKMEDQRRRERTVTRPRERERESQSNVFCTIDTEAKGKRKTYLFSPFFIPIIRRRCCSVVDSTQFRQR